LHWLYQINPLVRPGEITSSTPLLQEGVLNSIQLMELILYIERLSERPIEIEALKPSSFKTVDSIYRHFFQGVRS